MVRGTAFLSKAAEDRWRELERRDRGIVPVFTDGPFGGQASVHISKDSDSLIPWCGTGLSNAAGHVHWGTLFVDRDGEVVALCKPTAEDQQRLDAQGHQIFPAGSSWEKDPCKVCIRKYFEHNSGVQRH